jgi:hypothetical protein
MFFQKTKFTDPVWNIIFEIPESTSVLYEKHFTNVEEIIPSDLLDKFKTIEMMPEYVRLFVWPKNYCGIWHIDGTEDTYRNSAINWIIKGSGLIQFNSNIELGHKQGVHKGAIGTLLDEVEVETDGHGCLIDTSACHRVITKADGRNTISIGWKNKDVPFQTMIEKLHQINMI